MALAVALLAWAPDSARAQEGAPAVAPEPGSGAAAPSGGPLIQDDPRAIYALGVRFARDMQRMQMTPDEIAILQRGMDDFYAGKAKPDPADLEFIRSFERTRFQAALELENTASKAYLAQQAKAPGATKLPSGVIYFEKKAGTGTGPRISDTVSVTYTGRLRDGTVFDSSTSRVDPATVPLGRVLPCWRDALQRMKPGGKARFVCPSSLAYGERGQAPDIKPGAAIEFDVELLRIGE